MSVLREKLDDVNWTVGAVNHTFSNDISIHQLKIKDLQVRVYISSYCCFHSFCFC